LFFDLPKPNETEDADLPSDGEAEFSHSEKRVLLQKMFLQVTLLDQIILSFWMANVKFHRAFIGNF